MLSANMNTSIRLCKQYRLSLNTRQLVLFLCTVLCTVLYYINFFTFLLIACFLFKYLMPNTHKMLKKKSVFYWGIYSSYCVQMYVLIFT